MHESAQAGFDFVGDVHGMRASLRGLLRQLGYAQQGLGWSAPRGRTLVFVGDLVDRGPDSLGCVEDVQALAREGLAQMVLGNHELNALHFLHEPPLRPRTEKNQHHFRRTLDQIRATPARWAPIERFLMEQPLHLELEAGQIRVVHAYWEAAEMERLPSNLSRAGALRATACDGELGDLVERCLKGPEREEMPFRDAEGHLRTHRRVPWWRSFNPTAPITVFGHYWFPWPDETALAGVAGPMALGPGRNAIGLDWCAGTGGPVVAWRWPEREFVVQPNLDR